MLQVFAEQYIVMGADVAYHKVVEQAGGYPELDAEAQCTRGHVQSGMGRVPGTDSAWP